MVLESELKVSEGLKKPWKLFLISGIISLVSLAVSYFIFEEYTGLFLTFTISLALVPFIRRVNLLAEKREEKSSRKGIIERHREEIILYSIVFWGIIIFLSIAFVLLPET